MEGYKYTETKSETGDMLWQIEDVSLALGGVSDLVEAFLKKNGSECRTLTIYDTITTNKINISCSMEEMPKIAEYIYNVEKGTPLEFISVNNELGRCVVGMSITRGKVEFGEYKIKDSKLLKS